jgi:hypothetical protein
MKVEVLLEELGDHRFRAWTSRPFELSVEGATADESVASLKQLLNDRLSRVRVIEVEAGAPTENPLRALVGSWRDNPMVDEVVEHMRAYRQQVDADSGRL